MGLERITLNHASMAALLKGEAARAAIEPHLGQVHAAAIAGAPVDSGEYVASIHTEWATTDRLVGRVVADAPHALAVEADTGNLARALDSA